SSGAPDLIARVAGVRADMSAAGLGPSELKPIIVEEGSYTGAIAKSTSSPSDPFNVAQRDYVTKVLARSAAANVLAYFWFLLKDGGIGLGTDNAYGLIASDGVPKPSYAAFRYFTSLIDRPDRLT